ncbi:hypothetical protein LTR97_002390 [Elasticomyces elasticus]|uniref:Uncharacterized protein n=1 Tax=Elasticomyces elasticus TaxID=574655 RepID=A0AAN7WH08_9PEZI|nr:hypothetical protein LTR97_002390 [Elasticomyces elasticus]
MVKVAAFTARHLVPGAHFVHEHRGPRYCRGLATQSRKTQAGLNGSEHLQAAPPSDVNLAHKDWSTNVLAERVGAYRTSLDNFPREEARTKLQDDVAGPRLTAWLLSEPLRSQIQRELNEAKNRTFMWRFVHDSAYIIVGSGHMNVLKDFVLDMELDRTRVSEKTFNLVDHSWRGYVFAFICEATLSWNPRGSADQALDLVHTVAVKSRRFAAQGHPTDSRAFAKDFLLVQALVGLARRLRGNENRTTDPTRFEQFVAIQELYSNDLYRSLNTARLMFRHPRGPRTVPAVEAFREMEQNPQHDLCDRGQGSDAARTSLRMFAMDVARVLRSQGKSDDAKWLEEFAVKSWPPAHKSIGKTKSDVNEVRLPARVSMPIFTSPKRSESTRDSGW